MIRNFFIVAFRNLRRNKIFSIINILGLAIGMASAMLIGLWIQDEMGFDRFHAKEDRLFMMHRQEIGGRNSTLNWTPKILAPTLKSDFPDIEDVARWQNINFLMSAGDHHVNSGGMLPIPDFLKCSVFRYWKEIRVAHWSALPISLLPNPLQKHYLEKNQLWENKSELTVRIFYQSKRY